MSYRVLLYIIMLIWLVFVHPGQSVFTVVHLELLRLEFSFTITCCWGAYITVSQGRSPHIRVQTFGQIKQKSTVGNYCDDVVVCKWVLLNGCLASAAVCMCTRCYSRELYQRPHWWQKAPTRFEQYFVSSSMTWSIYFGFFSSCTEFHFTGVKSRKEK